MEKEKIYVVVPVYKVEAYLERCVESILAQTYDNYELILVDDGSPDHCPAICDRYAQQYDHITVIHQENGGLSAARNTGIAYALENGDWEVGWISFIDSDDFVHPQYLEYLYRAVKEAGAKISCCAYMRTSSSEISADDVAFAYTTFSPEKFWCRDRTNATIAWGKLYRLSYMQDIRFPVGKLHEDEFTTYKILFKCGSIAVMEMPLYYYYFNSTSITHTEWSPKRLDGLEALESQVTYFEQNQFPEARRESTAHLFQHSIKHLMYIKHLSPQYDYLVKDVKRWRNRAFEMYAKEVGLRKALDYWYLVRIKLPMKRVLGKESALSFLKRKLKRKIARR